MEDTYIAVEHVFYNILNIEKSMDEWIFVSPEPDSHPMFLEAAKQNYVNALSLTGDLDFSKAWAKLTWYRSIDVLEGDELLNHSVLYAEEDLKDVVQTEHIQIGSDVYTLLIIGENCTFIGTVASDRGIEFAGKRVK